MVAVAFSTETTGGQKEVAQHFPSTEKKKKKELSAANSVSGDNIFYK